MRIIPVLRCAFLWPVIASKIDQTYVLSCFNHADSAVNVTKFCADYKRGFVLGYSHRMYEKTGDRQLSAWEAGILTRRYGLDKEMVMDFFRENNSCSTLRFFMAGYRLEN